MMEDNDTENFYLDKEPYVQKKYDYFEQSANVLFKFMSKLDYLKEILKHKAIKPRYNEEKIDYLEIEGIDKLAFPMICFCDIHLNKLKEHMYKYGNYGIGLNKEWGIEQGVQPIHYINDDSYLRRDISSLFTNIFKLEDKERKNLKPYHDFLLHDLLYMKPINGEMFVDNAYIRRNFHDEREWRFIPSFNGIDTELPMVINQEQMSQTMYNSYSDGITKKPSLWLKVEFEKIKYILVNTHKDRDEIIDFIITDLNLDDNIRYILVSKILVYEELEGDW